MCVTFNSRSACCQTNQVQQMSRPATPTVAAALLFCAYTNALAGFGRLVSSRIQATRVSNVQTLNLRSSQRLNLQQMAAVSTPD